MKTNRKHKTSAIDNELFNAFKEVCADEESLSKAISDAKKTFSLVQKDAVY
jgi:hypothetical protein